MKSKGSSLMTFLYDSGIYDREHTLEDINALKRRYWREYKSQWRKNKRANNCEYTVYYSHRENKAIARAATAYGRSPTRFIHDIALSISKENRLVPNEHLFGAISESLIMSKLMIENFETRNHISTHQSDQIIRALQSIEEQITNLFLDPVLLDAVILRTVEYDETYRAHIINLLKPS